METTLTIIAYLGILFAVVDSIYAIKGIVEEDLELREIPAWDLLLLYVNYNICVMCVKYLILN